ncbi:MAG: hypothetical protein HY047_04750 [Acidobacteria bacterium]|nr:hypothetical protein [Acidobacteriota bacterium]
MTCQQLRTSWLLAGIAALLVSPDARGQGWALDVSAGRVVYDPASASASTNNAISTLRYDASAGAWVYGSAAIPLQSSASEWGAFGAGGRFLPSASSSRRVNIGADLSGQGVLFHDGVANQTGNGFSVDALPFVSVSAGAGSLEMRGGWRGHTLSYAGVTDNRGVMETGARASYGSIVRVEADGRWVRASEGTYPFLGGTLFYGGAPIQAWVQAGKWLSPVLDDVAWSGGLNVALGRQATLWGTVRQDAPDPLYWNVARRTWSVGVTRRLGRGAPALVPLSASRSEAGVVTIRVSASDVPGTVVAIGGDFNTWQPLPMRREGSEWVLRLPLAPGVYHYAFRSGTDTWFVPPSAAGRHDDGMGGFAAVLVVN